VSTDARRRGIGRELVADALVWMRRSGFATAYVNTGVGNAAALTLYEGFGFVRMDDQLVIAERRLDA
jgi:ribosomal protein S18 acetylase RimI-like enzyme